MSTYVCYPKESADFINDVPETRAPVNYLFTAHSMAVRRVRRKLDFEWYIRRKGDDIEQSF